MGSQRARHNWAIEQQQLKKQTEDVSSLPTTRGRSTATKSKPRPPYAWAPALIYIAAAAAAKSLQSCPTLCDPIDGSPTGSPVPGILQGKNTGEGCHFLFQCVKVKSEREIARSCPTLSDPMDCSLPGSSVLGIFQARVLEWGAITFSAYLHYYLLIQNFFWK